MNLLKTSNLTLVITWFESTGTKESRKQLHVARIWVNKLTSYSFPNQAFLHQAVQQQLSFNVIFLWCEFRFQAYWRCSLSAHQRRNEGGEESVDESRDVNSALKARIINTACAEILCANRFSRSPLQSCLLAYVCQLVFLYFVLWRIYQAIIIYVPAAEDWFIICPGRYWFHSLPHKTGPVVSQDIMDPPWHGLVTVAGHLRAILRVLKTQCTIRLEAVFQYATQPCTFVQIQILKFQKGKWNSIIIFHIKQSYFQYMTQAVIEF